MEDIKCCEFCLNARIDDELTDDNDFSSRGIGESEKGKRIMLSAGWGKPLRIETEHWNENRHEWVMDGIYYPKFCPECGRPIFEYERKEENG